MPREDAPSPELHWDANSAQERGPIVFRFENPTTNGGKRGNAFGIPRGNWSVPSAIAEALGRVDLSKPDYAMIKQSFALTPSADWRDIASFDPWGMSDMTVHKTAVKEGLVLRPTGACIRTTHNNDHIAALVRDGALEPDGKLIHPNGTYEVNSVVFEQVWRLPKIAEAIGKPQRELRRKLHDVFARGDIQIPVMLDERFEVWAPGLGEVIISIFGDPAKLADPSVEVACRLHDSCMCGDKDSCRCSCKVNYNQAVEFCLRLAKNGGVGFVAEFLNEGRALGLTDKHLIYLIREFFGDQSSDYFASAEMLWGGEGKRDGRLPFVRADVLRLLLGARRKSSLQNPTIHYWVSESPDKELAAEAAGFNIGMKIALDDRLLERRSVNMTEVIAKREKGGYGTKINGNGHKAPGAPVEDLSSQEE